MTFGERVREMRNKHGMTQAELAQKLDSSLSTVKKIEQDDREPSLFRLNLLSEVFNCSFDYLLGKTDDPAPKIQSENMSIIELDRLLDAKRRFVYYNYELSERDVRRVRRTIDLLFEKELDELREIQNRRNREIVESNPIKGKYD